jgi:hypothetical protein
MTPITVEPPVTFDGSNWADLLQLTDLVELRSKFDDDLDTDPKKCAYLATKFRGPALEWASKQLTANSGLHAQFSGYVLALRLNFGLDDEAMMVRHRILLDQLTWSNNAPLFFAEFESLCSRCNILEPAAKKALLDNKLPVAYRQKLADLGLAIVDWSTLKERIMTIWLLQPSNQTKIETGDTNRPASKKKRTRCSKCGKRGHEAKECRSKN